MVDRLDPRAIRARKLRDQSTRPRERFVARCHHDELCGRSFARRNDGARVPRTDTPGRESVDRARSRRICSADASEQSERASRVARS
jgi:hypothetical protein